MDISNLVHSKTGPVDMIYSDSSTTSPQPPLPSVNTPFPGPLLATAPSKDHLLHPARTSRTALLLIDIQRGINTTHACFGSERSTPQFEDNISLLLAACRRYNAQLAEGRGSVDNGNPVQIIHIFHQSSSPTSPLHPSGTTQRDGMQFMPCAEPDASSPYETVFSKTKNSAFADGKVGAFIEGLGIDQLVVAGLVIDHCVNSSIRWARDSDVVRPRGVASEEVGKRGTIVVVRDATACFGKGGFDAETVQSVSLACLQGEFAEVMGTGDVLGQVFG